MTLVLTIIFLFSPQAYFFLVYHNMFHLTRLGVNILLRNNIGPVMFFLETRSVFNERTLQRVYSQNEIAKSSNRRMASADVGSVPFVDHSSDTPPRRRESLGEPAMTQTLESTPRSSDKPLTLYLTYLTLTPLLPTHTCTSLSPPSAATDVLPGAGPAQPGARSPRPQPHPCPLKPLR